MTLGSICFLLAVILFFLAAASATTLANASSWGLFCLSLGFLLDDYDLGFRRRR